jgi:hypothetical protein
MFLYRSQPKNVTDSNIINLETKRVLKRRVIETQSRYNNKRITNEDVVALMTDGSVLDGMLTLSGYQNILVVTSFENNTYDRLRDRNYRPIKSAGDHMLPIVHKTNESEGNIYVTKVRNSENYYAKLYEEFDIPFVDVDSCFRIDQDFKIKTDVKFDAVVLLGCESYKKGKFNKSDIKAKFAKYCTDDFDLIDVYRGDRRNIIGGTKSIDTQLSRMIETVNTPRKVYDVKDRIVTRDFDEEFGDVYMKQKLAYLRLGLNIEYMNEYYKVF